MTKIQLTVVALALALVAIGAYSKGLRFVPRCQEDAVIVGMGDFNHGRWSEHVCGPSLDDFGQWQPAPNLDTVPNEGYSA